MQKKHARWVKNIRNEIKELIDKIQEAEYRRSELMEEVKEPKELVFAPYIDCISVILQYFITLYLIADFMSRVNYVTFLRNVSICYVLTVGI